jgi:hypothetical protein
MTAIDTKICAPESVETLLLQQRQLAQRKRSVQMFPCGTFELGLPVGASRHENERGVYHFWPDEIPAERIEKLSVEGRENEFLNLGPFSKADIAARAIAGEPVTCVAEYSESGIEIRCAAATACTAPEQVQYFEKTKEPGSAVTVGVYPARVRTAWLGGTS